MVAYVCVCEGRKAGTGALAGGTGCQPLAAAAAASPARAATHILSNLPPLCAVLPLPRPCPAPALQHAERLDSEIVYDRDFDYDYFGFKVRKMLDFNWELSLSLVC